MVGRSPWGPMTMVKRGRAGASIGAEGGSAHAGAGRPVEMRASRAAVHASLGSIERDAWNALFPGDVEDYDLYRTFEGVPPPGFALGALTMHDSGRLVAAAPLFETSYRLDTPFQGGARRLADWVHARVPGLTRLKVIGIGSPLSDNCSIGFAAGLADDARLRAFGEMVARLQEAAAVRRAAIVAVKSLASEASRFHSALVTQGFARVTSVPVVMLPLPYASFDHYLASLPAKTGAYFRRKLRKAEGLRIEYRDTVDGLEADLNRLLAATLAQSGANYGDFDELHPRYFRALLEGLGARARLMLCWKGDELLSFQVFLVGDKRIIANKIGMKYPEAREHNLYFVNFLRMIELAIEHGIPEIEMGATSYSAKLLFGGQIERRWLYFRFRTGVVNRLVRPLAPLFDFERNDPALRQLAAEGRHAAHRPEASA